MVTPTSPRVSLSPVAERGVDTKQRMRRYLIVTVLCLGIAYLVTAPHSSSTKERSDTSPMDESGFGNDRGNLRTETTNYFVDEPNTEGLHLAYSSDRSEDEDDVLGWADDYDGDDEYDDDEFLDDVMQQIYSENSSTLPSETEAFFGGEEENDEDDWDSFGTETSDSGDDTSFTAEEKTAEEEYDEWDSSSDSFDEENRDEEGIEKV